MSKKVQNLVNVGGAILDADSIDLPPRRFRDAWQFDGKAVTVHMPTARRMRAEQLVREADEKAAAADKRARMKAFDDADDTKDAAEVMRFKGKPRRAALAKLRNAKTAEDLRAVSVDELF